jgi:hypothetical protein
MDLLVPTDSPPFRPKVPLTKHIVAQSYGGGVQSRALLHLAIGGHIARPDVAIFADTHQEPEDVYRAVAVDAAAARAAGIDFRAISYGDLANPPRAGVYTPLFTVNLEIGKKGQLIRTCTERFKIGPIRRELRAMGARSAEMWLGISTDEIQRLKPSNAKWIENRFPLIDANMSRNDCLAFLSSIGIEATRSACTFCPYKGREEWTRLSPTDLASAIAYDESIRHSRPGFLSYCHGSRTPLREAVPLALVSAETDECSGTCWS